MKRTEPFEIQSVFTCSANKYSGFCQCKNVSFGPQSSSFIALEEGRDKPSNCSIIETNEEAFIAETTSSH